MTEKSFEIDHFGVAPIVLEKFKEKGHKINFFLSCSDFAYDFTRAFDIRLGKLDKKDGELIDKGDGGQGNYHFRIHLKSLDAFRKLMNSYPLTETIFFDKKGALAPKIKMINDARKIIQATKKQER